MPAQLSSSRHSNYSSAYNDDYGGDASIRIGDGILETGGLCSTFKTTKTMPYQAMSKFH